LARKLAGVVQKRLRLCGHQQQQLNAKAESEELRRAAAPGWPAKKKDAWAPKTACTGLTVKKRRAVDSEF